MAQRGTKRGAARGDLIDAALVLFDRHGFHAVGIDRILAAAGVAKMTLYHHFPSKEALIEAALARRDAAFRARIGAALGTTQGEARVAALFDAFEAWTREPEYRGSLFDKAAGEYPDRDHPVRRAVLAHKAWLFAEMRAAAAALGAADPVALGAELFILLEGAASAAATTGDRGAARRARAAAATLIAAAMRHRAPA